MRHSRELSAEEFHALSASWKLTEQCSACGRLTEWSFAEPEVRTEEQADFWDWLATTGEYFEPALSTPQRERRRERHVEVPTLLRIVGSAGEAEELVSKNISKNGLCFSSRRRYQPGERIQVTLPPVRAADLVTKSGVIVRAAPTPDGATRYGVRLQIGGVRDPLEKISYTSESEQPGRQSAE